MSTHSIDFSHLLLFDEPLSVLTKKDCEDTGHWTSEQFALLGLDYGAWNGEDYPLTDEEANRISYRHVSTPGEGILMFGYTALLAGQKCLLSAISYMQPILQSKLKEELRTLATLVVPYQGRVILKPKGLQDRVTILILIPVKRAEEQFGSAHVWERYLERGLGIVRDA